jgi:hypothetical protein
MTSEVAKTISTCAIWLATAVILTFGVFRVTMSGGVESFCFLFVVAPLIIAGAAAGATTAVWYPWPAARSGHVPRPEDGSKPSTPPSPMPEEHGITRELGN